MRLRVTATGDFTQLQAGMQGLNQAMARSGAGFARTAGVRIANPIENLSKALEKGTLNTKQFMNATRNSGKYLREHNALTRATGSAYINAAGQATVFLKVQRALGLNTAGLGQKMKFLAGNLHAYSRGIINFGKNMQWAGRQVMVGLTLPLVLLGAAATKAAEAYDKQMTRVVKVTQFTAERGTEAHEMQMQSVRNQTMALTEQGAALGFMAQETSKVVAEFSQMGYIGAQLNQLTEATTKLSRVSGAELDTSLELTRLTAQAFGVELSGLTEQFARLNLIENNTALSLNEMADALPVVAGVANTMGLEIAEVSGLLAMMKENGISAREGATALRTGLIQIVQEATDPAIEAFEKIGLSLVDMKERMQNEGEGDVLVFFDELGRKLKSLEGDQAALNDFTAAVGKLTGTRQAARFLTFLSEIPDRMKPGTVAYRAWIGANADAAEAMATFNFELDQVNKSAAGIAERLRAELNVELVKLGQNLLPVLNKARQLAVDVLKWFNELSDSAKRTTLGFMGFVASLGVGTMMLGILANAFGQILALMTIFWRNSKILTATKAAEELAFGRTTAAIMSETAAIAANTAARTGNVAAVVATSAAHSAAVGTTAAAATATTAATAAAAAPAAAMTFGDILRRRKSRRLHSATGPITGPDGQIIKGSSYGRAPMEARRAAARSVARGESSSITNNAAMKGRVAASSLMYNASKLFHIAVSKFGGWIKSLGGVLAKLPVVGALAAKGGAAGAAVAGAGKAVGSAAMAPLKFVAGFAAQALAPIAGAITAIIGPLLAVAAIIGGIAILANPKAFVDKFKASVMPAIERFKTAWVQVKKAVADFMATFRKMGEEGSGIAKMAEWVGWIAGQGIALLIDGFTSVLQFVEPILTVIQTIGHVIEAVVAAATGDWEGFGVAVGEIFKGLFRTLVDLAVWSGKQIITILGYFKGDWAEDLAEKIQNSIDFAESGSRWYAGLSTKASEFTASIKEGEQAEKKLGLEIQSTVQYKNDLIKAGLISEAAWEREAYASNKLTDEMKIKLQLMAKQQQLQIQIAAVTAELAHLEELSLTARSYRMKVAVQGKLNKLLERWAGLEEKAIADVARRSELAQKLTDEQEDYNNSIAEGANEAERLANAYSSALQSGMGEVMGDIVKSVNDALADQQKALDDAFKKRRDAIEETAKLEIKRIDDKIKREEEAERKRKEYFEAEKARIEYLERKESGNIDFEEAIRRGELSNAAKIRVSLQADSEKFMLDSYRREEERFTEARKQQVQDQKDSIEAIKDQQLAQLDVEQEIAQAAQDARARSIENYLRDWQRITPKTEAEFKSHLAKLGRDLNAFGISGKDISQKFSFNFNSKIEDGFKRAAWIAATTLAESEKWGEAGKQAAADFIAGAQDEMGGLSEAMTEVLKKHYSNMSGLSPTNRDNLYDRGSGITNPDNKPPTTRPPSTAPVYVPPNAVHSGAFIDDPPNAPGLKRNESMYILQHGEYVVQKSAVDTLGKDYMEHINNAARKHSGGFIDASTRATKEGGGFGPMTGKLFGEFLNATSIGLAGELAHFHKGAVNNGPIAAKKLGSQGIKDIAKMVKGLAPETTPGGTPPSGPANGKWPPRRWGSISANTKAARDYFLSIMRFAGGIGVGLDRADKSSDHGWGKALDFMVAPLGKFANREQRAQGYSVSNWLLKNPGSFGTNYVIWDGKIRNTRDRDWRPYKSSKYDVRTATGGHYDHVHASFLHQGGMALPQMRNGGKIKMDNTIANLHRGETVLTAPVTKALEQNVKGMSAGNTYNLEFHIGDSNMDTKSLAREVIREIERAERGKSRGRVISG
jgi:TP901 family phage tail tape measure protein